MLGRADNGSADAILVFQAPTRRFGARDLEGRRTEFKGLENGAAQILDETDAHGLRLTRRRRPLSQST